MSDKQMVLEAVGSLPEAVTLDQIRDEIELIAGLKRGLADSKAGRVKSSEEMKKRVKLWSTK